MMQTSKGTNRSVFQPTFGNRPDQYIGRDGVIEQFMAGLPHAVSSVLNDKVLTFLNRATKVELGLISTNLIRAYYEQAFKSVDIEISDDILDRAALASRGFPYLMQLIGYYLIQYTKEGDTVDSAIMDKSEKAAMGVIEAPRRGELVFAVPYLADYLINQ